MSLLGLYVDNGARVVLLVALVGIFLPVLWDPRGRGLHDQLANTVVVLTRG